MSTTVHSDFRESCFVNLAEGQLKIYVDNNVFRFSCFVGGNSEFSVEFMANIFTKDTKEQILLT